MNLEEQNRITNTVDIFFQLSNAYILRVEILASTEKYIKKKRMLIISQPVTSIIHMLVCLFLKS